MVVRGFAKTRSICVSRQVEAVALEKGLTMFYMRRNAQALPASQALQNCPPFTPTPLPPTHATPSRLSPRPKQLNWGQIQNAWGFGLLICSISQLSPSEIAWFEVLSPPNYLSNGKSPLPPEGRWKNVPITSLSSFSMSIIGANSFVHFDLLTSKLIWFQLSFKG